VVRVVALILLGLVLGGACGAAGVWQWHRFGQKKTADDQLRAAAGQPVAPVDEGLVAGRAVDDTIRFRTVTLTGRYDATRQLLVRQRQVNDTPGSWCSRRCTRRRDARCTSTAGSSRPPGRRR
jgi:Uncharacterized conserved protein